MYLQRLWLSLLIPCFVNLPACVPRFSRYVPAIGDPTMHDIPWKSSRMPKALFNLAMPKRSMRTIDRRAINAAEI